MKEASKLETGMKEAGGTTWKAAYEAGQAERLRVVHVIGGDDTGGVMTHLLPLLNALLDRDIDLHLLCMGGGGLVQEAARRGIPHRILPMSGPFDPRVLPHIRAELAEGGWQVVHTHGSRANLPVRALRMFRPSALRFARGAAQTLPCYFTTIHSDLLLDYDSRLRASTYGVCDRATLAAVDQLICVSEDLRRRLMARGYPAAKLVVVRPGLELDATRPLPEERQRAWLETQTSGISAASPDPDIPEAMAAIDAPNARWVGTVARLVGVKDIDLMLRSFAQVAQAYPAARLAIVGDGPDRSQLQQTALDLGIGSRVAFPGRLPTIWPAMRRLSVYWLTSISEGLPLSIMEAMSTGLPVVATAVGGVPEAVEDGMSGYLVPRVDRETAVGAMAHRVVELLQDAELCLRMGRAGASRVMKDFVPEAAARRYQHAYRRAMAVIG